MVPCTVGWRGNFFLACAKAVAKDHRIGSGSLFKKIDALHSKGLIAEFARRTAHTVRTFGNDMAHGDFTVDVDQEDAEGVLAFMDYILREVYQAPAELQRLQDSADARKPDAMPEHYRDTRKAPLRPWGDWNGAFAVTGLIQHLELI